MSDRTVTLTSRDSVMGRLRRGASTTAGTRPGLGGRVPGGWLHGEAAPGSGLPQVTFVVSGIAVCPVLGTSEACTSLSSGFRVPSPGSALQGASEAKKKNFTLMQNK